MMRDMSWQTFHKTYAKETESATMRFWGKAAKQKLPNFGQ